MKPVLAVSVNADGVDTQEYRLLLVEPHLTSADSAGDELIFKYIKDITLAFNENLPAHIQVIVSPIIDNKPLIRISAII